MVAVEETMRGPGRCQQRIARADRDPLAAQERVEPALLDDDGHFRVRIDGSWYPGIRCDRHLLDVERLASEICIRKACFNQRLGFEGHGPSPTHSTKRGGPPKKRQRSNAPCAARAACGKVKRQGGAM
jgi:hypothetical protein